MINVRKFVVVAKEVDGVVVDKTSVLGLRVEGVLGLLELLDFSWWLLLAPAALFFVRCFKESLVLEWITLIDLDLDFFMVYNDTYSE